MIREKSTWYVLLAIILLVAFASFAFTGWAVLKMYRIHNPYVDIEIGGPLALDKDWLRIELKEPIKPERPQNEISLVFEEEYPNRVPGVGLNLADGSILTPEIELIDVEGNVFRLNLIVALGPRGLNRAKGDPLTWKDTLPLDRTYRAVRLRSDKAVVVSKIFWHSYDPRDLK